MRHRALRLRGLRAAITRHAAVAAWRPVALRWRRRLPPAHVATRASHAAPPVVHVMHLHVHRHFGHRADPRLASIVRRESSIARELRLIERHVERVARFTVERHLRDRWRLAQRSDARTAYTARMEATTSASRAADAAPRSAPVAAPAPRAPFASMASIATLRHARRIDQGTRTVPPLSAQQPTLMRAFRSGEGMRFPASAPAPHADESRVSPVFPVELAWRRTAGAPSDVAPPSSPVRMLSAAAPLSPPAATGAVQATVRQAATAAEGVPARLDPSVLDRLADDVIRRVERRARIERERRGL